MHLKHINNKIVEYPIMNLRKYLKDTSLPLDLTKDSSLPKGFAYVHNAPMPQYDAATHKIIQQKTPTFDGTKWVLGYSVIEKSKEELNQSIQEVIKQIVENTQQHLDDFARSKNYDNILSACTYATSTISKFALEGKYCVEMRDLTWNTLYGIIDEIESGKRKTPSNFLEILPELPELVWPTAP